MASRYHALIFLALLIAPVRSLPAMPLQTASMIDEAFLGMQLDEEGESNLRAGRYREARRSYRDALEVKRRRFGKRDLEVAKTLLGLARAELKLGDPEKALAAQQEALSIRTERLKPDDWLIAAVYDELSQTLSVLGRLDEAARAKRKDIDINEKRLGPNHPRLGALWLEYAGLLRRAGRSGEAARAEAHGHEVYAAAPQGPPRAMASPLPDNVAAKLPPEIRTVISGPVTAHFGGEKPENAPLRFGVRAVWFTFAGDKRLYPFHPEGTLFFSDWRFDIFSPDGSRVLLLQDRFGPYHVVRTTRLKAYLIGHAQPDEIVGQQRKAGEPAAVHEDATWLSETAFRYYTACCGDRRQHIHRLHFYGYQPRPTLDLAVDYRPGLRDRLRRLPTGTGNLPDVVRAFRRLSKDARRSPGRWEKGRLSLGAKPREYVPSDAELLLADVGDYLVQLVKRRGRKKAARELTDAGLPLDDIVFHTFTFRHADVMGTGRFYYASAPRKVRLTLAP